MYNELMKPVIVLQHIACETLGTIENLLVSKNIPFRYVKTYAGEPVPKNMGESSALIVMGGPMGVYETDIYPFLKEEMRLIENALHEQRPVLGICLGSQLLAAVLGSRVRKGRQKEIGWHPVRFSEEGKKDALMAFHWHGDIFDLPKGAALLASSELTQVQAYRYNKNVYGFLFHMEVTEMMIRDWVMTFSDELSSAKIDAKSILNGIPTYLPNLNSVGKSIFGAWVGSFVTESLYRI